VARLSIGGLYLRRSRGTNGSIGALGSVKIPGTFNMYTKFHFGDFTLDSRSRELTQGHKDVHLSPKAFDLLRTLLVHWPRAIARSELHEDLWPGVFVSDGNLPLLINEIRNALQDQPTHSRYIRTVPRFGYAFCAHVEQLPDPANGASAQTIYWLLWATRSFALADGPNIIGREPGVDVLLDVVGISRRHAQITIDGSQAILEDLGSKNGTFVGGQLSSVATPLADGDRIQFGQAALMFKKASASRGTETLVSPRSPRANTGRRRQ
jgi:DNA-binding winged helix-turn-helix (wHTH) protein